MKTIAQFGAAIFFLSAIYSLAYSATPGTYIGAGLAETQLDTPDKNLFDGASNSRKLGGPGGRAFAGYNFNEYLGVEAGIAYYAKSKYTGSTNYTHSSLDYSMNAIDLVAKTYLPFGDKRFNLFALGGVAAVSNTVQLKNDGIPFINDFIIPNRGSKARIRPIYGIGAGYDIPKSHVTASVELTRIQGVGSLKSSPNAMPPANMVAFTLTYNFGS